MKKIYTTGLVEKDGVETEYVHFGSGEKPLVILPGLGIKSVIPSAKAIAEAYAAFDEDYSVYLFERRRNVPDGYTTKDMADDTVGAMRAVGIEKADIFGVSQGGMIAQLVAALYPETVRRLVIASSVSKIPENTKNEFEKWIDLACTASSEELTDAFSRAIYSDGFYSKYGKAIIMMNGEISGDERSRFVTLAKAALEFDAEREAERIKCPVLVLGSKRDKLFPEESLVETAKLLRAEIYLYDGFGHAVYDEAPDIKDRIKGFLEW